MSLVIAEKALERLFARVPKDMLIEIVLALSRIIAKCALERLFVRVRTDVSH